MKKYKGLIFDFNGTLLWDTPLHNLAWDRFLEKYHFVVSHEEKHEHFHGKTNREILEFLFRRELSTDEMEDLAEEKEILYRELCLEVNLGLAEGVRELFDYCTLNNIPMAIATSSQKINLDFFVQRYELHRWFSPERIVYNDGTIRSKPDPQMFHITMDRLGLKPEEVIIFEDSLAGIRAAEAASTGKVVVVNSNQERYPDVSHEVIIQFADFDRNLVGTVGV